MARVMKLAALAAVVLTVVFAWLDWTPWMITAGAFAYHLLMRLAVGGVFNLTMRNRVDYNHAWFQLRKPEQALYERLQVGRWKTSMPTYDPDAFDRHKHTWDEIAQAMCQAELVHEVIVVLSFLPAAIALWRGEDQLVFLLTSLAAACYDMMFIMMQRYNRPRILNIVQRLRERTAGRSIQTGK